MSPQLRNVFPYIAILVAIAAIVWAVSFGTLPQASFTFINGDEVKTVDPPKATGAPEGRVINGLFEGLLRNHPIGLRFDGDGNLVDETKPDENGNVPMDVVPAMAESYEVSKDGTKYTFKIRESAAWSDGTPVTAHDFVWSWRRMLHPETASRYAYQLYYYVTGAKKYNQPTHQEAVNGQTTIVSALEPGDRVEVELKDREVEGQPFPRGTIRRGVLKKIVKPPMPKSGDDKEAHQKQLADWVGKWIYVVDVKEDHGDHVHWHDEGETAAFSTNPSKGDVDYDGTIETCHHVLSDFDSRVGIRATDDHTLVVQLENRTPFFKYLVAFYPLYPVNRQCVEKYGSPDWTKPENIVCNGPFLMQFRRIRDRVRMVKNPKYWNEKIVRLETIDALAVKSETTQLNMFLNNQAEWATTVPNSIMADLLERDDFLRAPALITYFYRLNVKKPPLDDVHVRRALNMAIDKRLICEKVTKAGQQPARSITPPGMAGYTAPQCEPFDVEAAQKELAKSKYAKSGEALPKLEILYNTSEGHRAIAEVIQQQWKNNLGIDVELTNSEWATFLDSVHQTEYKVARAGWIGDYPDPNTFVDMWVSGGENNETNWSNAEYDRLVFGAQAEPDPTKRMQMLHDAEEILMDEMPIIPVYFYVSINMVSPRVKGFYANIQDLHPLHVLRVE